MHLWPSLRLRDSFKHNYLKKLDWNLSRMNSVKDQSNNQTNLLDSEGDASAPSNSKTHHYKKALLLCREILMILSCCYCCFCCGACVDDEDERT